MYVLDKPSMNVRIFLPPISFFFAIDLYIYETLKYLAKKKTFVNGLARQSIISCTGLPRFRRGAGWGQCCDGGKKRWREPGDQLSRKRNKREASRPENPPSQKKNSIGSYEGSRSGKYKCAAISLEPNWLQLDHTLVRLQYVQHRAHITRVPKDPSISNERRGLPTSDASDVSGDKLEPASPYCCWASWKSHASPREVLRRFPEVVHNGQISIEALASKSRGAYKKDKYHGSVHHPLDEATEWRYFHRYFDGSKWK